jgi:hypothetical protein
MASMSPQEAPHRSKLTSQDLPRSRPEGRLFVFSIQQHRTPRKEVPDIEASQAKGLRDKPLADLDVPTMTTVEPERLCSPRPSAWACLVAAAYPVGTGEQHGGHMQPCPNEAILPAYTTTHRSDQYANWPPPSSPIFS